MRDESSSDTSQKKALQETELVGIGAVLEPLPCLDWHWQLCLSLAHCPTSTSAILVPVLGRWHLYGSHSCAVPALLPCWSPELVPVPLLCLQQYWYLCQAHIHATISSNPTSFWSHSDFPAAHMHTITNPPLVLYEFMCHDVL